MARCCRIPFRPSARHGLRRRAHRGGPAALGVRYGAGRIQSGRGIGAACSDSPGVRPRRLVQAPRLVPPTRRGAGITAHRVGRNDVDGPADRLRQ